MEKDKDRYEKAIGMTLALARERLTNELVALYLGGSYLRNDFVPGWSDLDISTIVKDEVWENESLKREFFRKCSAIREEVAAAYPNVEVFLGWPRLTTSESAVRTKVNLASFLARNDKLIYGEDIRSIDPRLQA